MDVIVGIDKLMLLEGETFEQVVNDHGGATKNGVIQSEYDTYRDKKGLPLQSVAMMSDPECQDIYVNEYWGPAGCKELPDRIDFLHFQWAVNHGVASAARCLKAAVWQRPQLGDLDGPVDEKDRYQILLWPGIYTVQERYLAIQSATYDRISQAHAAGEPATQLKFFNGWENRIQRVRDILAGHPLSV